MRSFEGYLAAAEAFQDQDEIDGVALASGLAAIRARAEAGFDACTYLEMQGTRGANTMMIWEGVLLAALATHIGLAGEVDPRELESARRLGLA